MEIFYILFIKSLLLNIETFQWSPEWVWEGPSGLPGHHQETGSAAPSPPDYTGQGSTHPKEGL